MKTLSHEIRLGLLAVAGIAVFVSIFAHSMPQPRAYHLFADARSCLGIPNFFNTASNLGFLAAGASMLILLYTRRRKFAGMFIERGELWIFVVLYAATLMVTFGSGYYHLVPDNARLFWDRLPMTLVASAFVGTIVADRFGARAGVWSLVVLFVLSCGSLAYWLATQSLAQDNVWPYIATVYGSLAFAVVAMALFPSRYTHAHAAWITLAIYIIAMAFDTWLDAPLYAGGAILSGHSLKHLLAALALFWLGWGALPKRRAKLPMREALGGSRYSPPASRLPPHASRLSSRRDKQRRCQPCEAVAIKLRRP